MKVEFKLKPKERKLIEKSQKTILVRPKNSHNEKVKKGSVLDCGDVSLLVLDVRKYPKVNDLLRIEKLKWVTVEADEMVDAFSECLNEFKDEHENGDEFLAIEFSVQK